MPFAAYAVDVDGAVRRALENRTDVQLAKNSIEQSEVNLKFYRGQILPEVNANLSYQPSGIGGTVARPHHLVPSAQRPTARCCRSAGFGSVLGDVFTEPVSRRGRSACPCPIR